MSSLLYRLAHTMSRHRVLVIGLWLAALILGGAAAGLVQKGTDDSFTIPGSSSQQALDALHRTFPAASGSSAQIVVVVPSGRVDAAPTKPAIEAAIKDLGTVKGVAEIVSPFSGLVSGQVADSGRAVIITVPLTVSSLKVTETMRNDIRAQANRLAAALPAGSQVDVGGQAFANVIPKLSLLEAIGVVIALLALMALFRSLLASILPLATALIGVGVTVALIYGATAVVTVSSTAPMLALMLGLAVGIDYALLILSRHRDQLVTGMAVEDSIARAVATAGSAVVFAGLTVIIALLGLGVVGIPFLTVMGIGAAVAVTIALLIAVTLLPAIMSLAGERLRPKKTRRSAEAAEAADVAVQSEPGQAQAPQRHHVFQDIAHHWVSFVTARPIPVLIGVLGLVVLLGWPAPSLRLGLPDNGATPPGTATRTTYDVVAREFGPGYNGPLLVTADIVASTDPLGVMQGLRRDIEALPHVKVVALSTPNRTADTGIIQVIPTSAPLSEDTSALVEKLREQAPVFKERYGVDTAVTGFTAIGIDVSAQLGRSLLPFGLVVVGLCLILLTIVFRSIVVPIKATVGYVLSVLAAFGATSLVFTHGWLADLFRVTQVGSVISFLPILLMGVLFGLAMDYEVFIVSRMSEEYVHTGNARSAIVHGFTSSAPVVTVAAVIMLSVFAAFIPAENANLKPIAFGLTIGVLVDAFLVRMTFVPAAMALMGKHAWWLPDWLARRLPRIDIEGEAVVRELALANWPAPGTDEVLSAEGLRVLGPDGRPLAELGSAHVRPGQVLVLEGASGPVRALAAALSGRARGVEGAIKVAGLVLPERAREVRQLVVYGRADRSGELVADLQAALNDPPPLVVVEGIDMVPDGAPSRRASAAGAGSATLSVVVELLRTLQDAGTAIVVTCQDPAKAAAIFPPASLAQTDVAPPQPAALSRQSAGGSAPPTSPGPSIDIHPAEVSP